MIYFLTPDDQRPVGGIKTIYRHVDILNRSGLTAAVVHKKRGFRCTWFENDTRVEYQKRIAPTESDLVVIPEVYGPRSAEAYPQSRKVVFNQNAYYTFIEHPPSAAEQHTPYLNPQVIAVVVVSEDSRRYLQHAFPELQTYRVHLSVNPAQFKYRAISAKRPQIAYMPRKHPEDAQQVINILRFRGVLDGFRLAPIEGKTERETARILEESLIFLSFGYPEGWPAPPAEALLSGCVVIGYDGFGGNEFLRPEFAFPVANGDVLAFAREAERVIKNFHVNPGDLEAKTLRASQFIRHTYSLEREAQEVVKTYRKITTAFCESADVSS